MNRQISNGQPRFRCTTRIYAPEKCQCPSVKESILEQAILSAVQQQIQELVDAKTVIDAIRKENTGGRSQNEYKMAMDLATQERKRLSDAKFRLYDNLEKGLIDQDEYIQFKAKYNAGIAEQDSQIKQLQDNLMQIQVARKQDDEFVSFFKEFGTINSIDRDVLNRLVDHIEVTDARHIDIYFKFSAERQKILDFARGIEDQTKNNNVC